MAKIYVSSTYLDLQVFREKIIFHLQRMKQAVTAMEYYLADDRRPADKCIADVEACDIYVGIFAWRYGTIPKHNNPQRLSITEMEYRTARDKKIPCLIFLHDSKSPWPPDLVDENQKRIKKFRKELEMNHTPQWFKNADELASLVGASLYDKLMALGYGTPSEKGIVSFDLERYFSALRKRYQTLALEGLTPPQKDEYLQVQLRSVFVEQNVRESPPPVELPKEVWDKLQRDRDVHPEDLPSGITFDDIRHAREIYFEKPARPVLEVLTDARHQQAIILGDPGSGKSTLARYIMLSLIEPTGDEKLRKQFNGYLPLLIELRTYTGACLEGNCSTFLEFLEYLGKTEGWHLTQAALHHHLKNDGRAVVIFDGLDEIFDPEKREQITRQIVGFANDYPKVRIIVTSRIIGYRRKILTDAGFTHFTLQDLDEKQVETFVDRWYDLALSDRPDEAKERKERILKSFKDSPSIRQLAGNPMLLTIMAIIGKHQELPRERWKLYDHAASVLIQHWDVNKNLEDKRIKADRIDEEDKKELLRRLAFRMQSSEKGLAGNYIHREHLQSEFEDYLIKRYNYSAADAAEISRVMIDQFRERNFILSHYGANLYSFVHRAFLEYFCASSIVNKFEKTKELTIEQLKTDVYGKHWEDQSWHEVLRLICGMIDEKWAGEIVEYLICQSYTPDPKNQSNPLPWHVSLAVQCLAELRNLIVTKSLNEKVLQTIFVLFDYRWRGVKELYNFISLHVLPSFKIIIPNIENKAILIDWLSKIQTDSIEIIYIDDDLFAQFVTSFDLSDGQLYDTLMSFAASQNEIKRSLALPALARGWKENKGVIELLYRYSFEDTSFIVRSAALGTLAEQYISDPNTTEIIKNRLSKDEDYRVRSHALRILTQNDFLRDCSETYSIVCESSLHDSSPEINDKKYEFPNYVREVAINALAEYWPNQPDTLNILKDRAKNDPTPWLRERAKELLEELLERKQKMA